MTRFKRMRNWLARFHRNDSGKMSAEVVLLIALIAIPILVALIAFRDKILGWFEEDQEKLGR